MTIRTPLPAAPLVARALTLPLTLSAALTLTLAAPAGAADFPTRPLRLVVPFAPGGSADLVGRIVAADAAPRLGQAIVVENRPGADGNVAANQVAKAAPDGYTLLLGTSTLAIVRTLTPELPYDVQKDLAPVIKIGSGAFVIAVAGTSTAKTIEDLIATVKARPRQLNFGTAASGSSTHLAGELFNMRAGIAAQHISYKGEPQALTGLIGNEVTYVVASYGATAGFLQAGRLRALGVTSPFRMKALPNVPTVAETGLQGFDAGYWNGIFATGKTPTDIVDKLYGALAAAARSAPITEKLENLSLRVEATRPQVFATELAADIEKWAGVIRTAKLTAQ